jgi:hypothetical protein
MKPEDAIRNLEVMSKVIEKAANSPQNYNSKVGTYLEIMSWELHKYARELKEINEFVNHGVK